MLILLHVAINSFRKCCLQIFSAFFAIFCLVGVKWNVTRLIILTTTVTDSSPSDSDVTHTVSVHLGEVLNPEATLYIYLIGRKGETSKVFLRPEELLEREKTYKFTLALTVDIGRVRQNHSPPRSCTFKASNV